MEIIGQNNQHKVMPDIMAICWKDVEGMECVRITERLRKKMMKLFIDRL